MTRVVSKNQGSINVCFKFRQHSTAQLIVILEKVRGLQEQPLSACMIWTS